MWIEIDNSTNTCPTDIKYNDIAFLKTLKKLADEYHGALKRMCDKCRIHRWWKHLWD